MAVKIRVRAILVDHFILQIKSTRKVYILLPVLHRTGFNVLKKTIPAFIQESVIILIGLTIKRVL